MKLVRIVETQKIVDEYEKEKKFFKKKNNHKQKYNILMKEFGGLYDILTRLCEFQLPKPNGKDRIELLKFVDLLLESLEIVSLDNVSKKFPKTSCQIYSGTYGCHPHMPEGLIPLKEFYVKLAEEKDCELVYLLGMLKAKEIRIEQKEYHQKSSKIGVGIPAIFEGVGGFVGVEVDKESSSEKSLVVKFQNTDSSIPKDLLEKSTWFKNDGQLNLFFKSRIEGQMTEYHHNFSNSYKDHFGLRLSLIDQCFGLQVGLKTQLETLNQIERVFHVEFYPYEKPKALQERFGEISQGLVGKVTEFLNKDT